MTPDDTQGSTQDDPQNGFRLEAQSPETCSKTARKKSPKVAWAPPKGIRYEYRGDRPLAPFYLHWRDPSGVRHKQSFKTEAARESEARILAETREREGTAILTFDPQRWRVYEQFQRIIGPDTDPLQVAREWKESRKAVPTTAPTLTVTKAVEQYLQLREAEGGVDAHYLSHVRRHLRDSLAVRLGHVLLHQVDATMLRDWLTNLKGRIRKGSTGTLGIEARRHYYRSMRAFLNRCVTEEWLAKNPCDTVAEPKPTLAELAASEEIKLMPVADVEALFRANRNHRVIGRLALEAFGGVRYSTAAKMKAEHINYEIKGLAMPGAIHKSRKRKFRQGHPDCLWKWLEHVKATMPGCWDMSEREYFNEKREAFVRANVTNPHNGLRHSFASYLLAECKSLPTVSYLMQHAKTTMTERYEGRASEQDAQRYLAITPESCGK